MGKSRGSRVGRGVRKQGVLRKFSQPDQVDFSQICREVKRLATEKWALKLVVSVGKFEQF
jgi:hypothetical protein